MTVNVIDRGVERKREGGLLVFGLLFAKGNQLRNAGILILLEVQAQQLLQSIARAEGLGVDRKHACVARAQLRIEIDADCHALDIAYAVGQL